MLLLRQKVGGAQTAAKRLVKAFFEHLDLGVELFGQVPKHFLFAKSVTVDEEFQRRVASPLSKNEFTHLGVSNLLARK